MTNSTPDEAHIFNTARRIQDARACRLYLEQACGDNLALRERVEALVRIHQADAGFLETPAAAAVALCDTVSERAGTQIGPYQLTEQIGEGGFGAVFMAEQRRPVRRKVALKVIKPGMDTRQVVARFEAERQALALMDHPNIARVLDVGETESGRPYFVMELVNGLPLTTFCDEHQLSLRQRLALFVTVCQAVQHAHQKGIIHRDLKPTNVLVTEYDGQSVPKIIDFGVAKALGEQLTEKTLETGFGGIIGTLQYMSPEQAEFASRDIDTRADIYSLGVLLYELLTGTTPLTTEEVERTPVTEVLRIIREDDPPRPSTRLAGSKETLVARLGRTKSEPSRLRHEVDADLDWIVMKALEKDRNRRYDTASGLARDIERYLNDEPVEACPPSALYRLRKLARRYKTTLATVSAFAAVLLVATVISIVLAVRAMDAERQARAEQHNALAERDAKEIARQEAVAQKQRADAEAAVATAVSTFLQRDLLGQADIANQASGEERKKDITVRELLDRAARGIEGKFSGQETTEAAIRQTLGDAYSALARYSEAEKHLLRSLKLRKDKLSADSPDTLATMNSLAGVYAARGEEPKADSLYTEVLDARRRILGAAHRDTLQTMNDYGSLEISRGHYNRAESLFREAVELTTSSGQVPDCESVNNLGVAYLCLGRFKEAEPLLKQALAGFRERLGSDHPQTLIASNNLAGCYMELRRYADAEPLYQEVFKIRTAALGADHPKTLFSMNFVALALDARGKPNEAEPLLRQVLEARRKLLGPAHSDTLTSESNLAQVLQKLNKQAEAESLFKQALGGQRKLGADHPDTYRYMNDLAVLYRDQKRFAEAEPLLTEAVTGARKILGPTHPQTQLYLKNLVELYELSGRPEKGGRWRQELNVSGPIKKIVK
jgi:non-specific serine/threonine protein kinase/serine/threonine-protein kinase